MNTNTLSILDNSQNNIIVKTLKSGAESSRPMTRKEYREANPGLRGAELKRAHYAYLGEVAKSGGVAVVAAVTSGELVVLGNTYNAETGRGSIKYVSKTAREAHKPGEAKPKAAKVSDAALIEMIVARGLTKVVADAAEHLASKESK